MQTINDNDFIAFVGRQESQYIIKPSELADDVISRLAGETQHRGISLPWSKTYGKVALRPGEVSVWAGVNGHGKSALLGQVCAWALNTTWLIASMEMQPSATMERMLKQVAGSRSPAPEFVRDFLAWTDNRLWLYDQIDTVKPERILGMIHYAAKVIHVKHIVIDSLMKCGLANDDYNQQKDFVDRLCWAAKSTGVHIHLVHHVRKGERESQIPDKFDIRGASEITDLVDNVFIIHRNKSKEARISRGEDVDPESPDCVLKVAKQRHGEWEGAFHLWHCNESRQFKPRPDERPMAYCLYGTDAIFDDERAAIQQEAML